MSFLKFSRKVKESGGKPVHWNRANVDGAPFRGTRPPLLREEEIEQQVEQVDDVHCGLFDISRPNQRIGGRKYTEVMEGVVGGLYKLTADRIFIKAKDPKTQLFKVLVYVEWAEPFMEYNKE